MSLNLSEGRRHAVVVEEDKIKKPKKE